MRRVLVLMAVVAAAFASTAVAQAQTTTTAPCGSGTENACGFNVDVQFGNMSEGESQSTGNPNFQPGSTCSVSVNGQTGDPITADANGNCPIGVTVLSDGVALGGLRLPLAVAGLQLAQANGPTQIRVNNRTFTGNAVGQVNTVSVRGAVPGPAANPGTYNVRFTIVGPRGATAGAGALSRTGTMIVRWSLLGGALVAVGVLFVMAGRRRREHDVAA